MCLLALGELSFIHLISQGDFSRRIESLTNSQVKSEVMTVLRKKIYPHLPPSEIPDPIDFYFERWWDNPLFRGSYSNWPASFFEEHHEDLVRMVGGRVGFAGEHTSAKHFGLCRHSLSRFWQLWQADESSNLKGSCTERISLALELRTRYVIFSCTSDACSDLSVVASELVRRPDHRMSHYVFFDVIGGFSVYV